MGELPKQGTKEYALADVLSRPNAINGLYRKLKFPLEWENLKTKDAMYITHMADFADNLIAEAISSGKDLDDPEVREELFAAMHGGVTGALAAINWHKFLRFLGIRR